MSESAIEQKVVREAKKLGVIGFKLTTPGNTGLADRMFMIPGGRPLYIEFKKPGEVLDPKQIYWYNIFEKLRYHIEVHENAEQAIQAIRKAVDAAQVSAESS